MNQLSYTTYFLCYKLIPVLIECSHQGRSSLPLNELKKTVHIHNHLLHISTAEKLYLIFNQFK